MAMTAYLKRNMSFSPACLRKAVLYPSGVTLMVTPYARTLQRIFELSAPAHYSQIGAYSDDDPFLPVALFATKSGTVLIDASIASIQFLLSSLGRVVGKPDLSILPAEPRFQPTVTRLLAN